MNFSTIRFNWALATAFLVGIATISGATAQEKQQEIGADICFCAPNVYEFELDFSLTCPPVNITLGDAVAATTCLVSPFGSAEVADLVPVNITSIDVLELNQNLQIMVNENISPNKAFLDGDTFTYTSYAAIPGEIVNPEDLPRAIQLNMVGQNKLGEEIINMYLITFTSSCGAYPVLFGGQWAGWTRFRDLGPPSPDLCPAAREPSSAPSLAPTASPTPLTFSMSMSMSMDMGLEEFSIADLLESEVVYTPKSAKSKGKGKAGKREKSKEGAKAGKSGKDKSGNKLSKPYSKDGKAKDGKAKDGKAKDGKSKDGNKLSKPYSKDGKSKDGKAKDGKSKDGKSKDGAKAGKSKDGRAKDGAKAGKSEKSKDGAKAGKSEKSKDGAKAGKSEKSEDGKSGSDSRKTANKLAKPGDKVLKQGGKDGKSKDGKSKDGKSKDGAKAGKSKDGKAKDGKSKNGAKAGKLEKSKDGAKAGKSYEYEGNGRKPVTEEQKEANKLQKSDKSKGKGGPKRLRR